MGGKGFGIACLVLAGIFTVAAARPMLSGQVGLVLMVPALTAVVLIIVGLKDIKKRKA